MCRSLQTHNTRYHAKGSTPSAPIHGREEVGVFCDEKEQGADCAEAGLRRLEVDLAARVDFRAMYAMQDNKSCEWKSRFTVQDFRRADSCLF